MTIDWKKEVELRKEDLLKDLFTLLRIDSVRDDSKATEDAPVGPGPKEALEAFLAIGERDGFTTKQVGNLAGHIEFAPNPDYKETLGVLGHVDVVPVGTGWDTDPFEPQIINDRIYARGSSDDKGPSMAAYYALKNHQRIRITSFKTCSFHYRNRRRIRLEMYGTLLPNRRNARLWFLTRRNIPNHQW